MPPSDEELSAMTGITDIDAASRLDAEMLESWMAKGFSRAEAFQLLLSLKNSFLTVQYMPMGMPDA